MKAGWSLSFGLLVLGISLTVSVGCRQRISPRSPVPPPVADVGELLQEADAALASGHLSGWHRAAAAYTKAYAADRSPATQDKLLLARFLEMTRRFDEDIAVPDAADTTDAVCSSGGARSKAVCDLARRYLEGYGATRFDRAHAPAEGLGQPRFDSGDAALDAYLIELFRRTYGIKEDGSKKEETSNPYADSPLFIYLNPSRNTLRRAAELEAAYPGFAELMVLVAEDQFQRTRYNSARDYFRKAVGLVPDYTRALNGLGNVYFFALEDFAAALDCYTRALTGDPANTTALFGSGAALHHLGRYAESTTAMDRVLASDLTRRGRAIPDSINYHRSEALFYKANNFYLLGNRAKAREFVDAATAVAANLEHANYLSALLRFEGGESDAATTEFKELLRRGTSICRANYYLGRLLHEARDTTAADHFLAACSCMQRTVQTMERQLGGIPQMELEEHEKAALRERLERKRYEFQLDSAGLIEAMVRIVESSWDPNARRYAEPMTDVLGRIRPAPAVP